MTNGVAQAATDLAQAKQGLSAPMLPADPMVSMIERIAMDPNSDIEKLEKMMDLKDRHDERQREDRAEEARQAFNAAMSKAQAEMPTVAKTRSNSHTRSTYADLADIERQAMPVAHRHGFAVSFTPGGSSDGNLIVQWTVMHEGGHTREGEAAFPLDGAGAQGKQNKTGIQAMGSTMTYARRYLLCNLFNIATGDDNDGNAQTAATITQEQYLELRDLIERASVDESVVCTAAGCETLPELPARAFEPTRKKLMLNIQQVEGSE